MNNINNRNVDLLTLRQLKDKYNKGLLGMGFLFCFGTSFISRLIQVKTRNNDKEIVPSHVAIIYNDMIYESTSSTEKINNKKIPAGVRRWRIKDFFKVEREKETQYAFYSYYFDRDKLEDKVHLPYGKDTIVEYFIKDNAVGDSKGLICSQYANEVSKPKVIDASCVTPAELYRAVLSDCEDM